MALFIPTGSLRRLLSAAGLLSFLLTSQAWAASRESVNPSANDAKNLARFNCGARITWISDQGARELSPNDRAKTASELLLDDNTLNCRMEKGRNTFLISLPAISIFDRFTFINEREDMAGSVQVFVSNYRLSPNDNNNWKAVGRKVDFGNGRFVNLSLAPVEAKYVRISFNVKKPGTIAGLGLYGERTLAAFADQKDRMQAAAARIAYESVTPPSQENLHYNFANLYARARVVSVSSGANGLVKRMIDDDPTTSFEFAANDPHPTVVVELEADQRLRRVSAIYENMPGRLDIYLLNRPPEADTFEKTTPAVSVIDNKASGKAAAEFYPRGARYVALRWTPSGHVKNQPNFNIAEIGAFSDLSFGVFDLQAIPEQYAQNTAVNPPATPPPVTPVSP